MGKGSNFLPYFYAHSDTFLHQQCIWVQIPYRTFMHTRTLFYTNSAYGFKFLTILLCTLGHFFYTNSVYGLKFLTVLLCTLGHFFTPTVYMGSNSLPYFYAHSDTFLHQQCIWVQIPYRTFMHTRTLFYTKSVYGFKFLTVLLCIHSDTFLHQQFI